MTSNIDNLNSTVSTLRDKCLKSARQESAYVYLTDGTRQCQIKVIASPHRHGAMIGVRQWGSKAKMESVKAIAYLYDSARSSRNISEPLLWREFREFQSEIAHTMSKYQLHNDLSADDMTKLWHMADRVAMEVMRETMTAVLDKWMHHGYRPTLSMDDPLQKMMADLYDFLAKRRGLKVEAYRIRKH